MKNINLLWGAKRIQGELLKLGIELNTKTIRNILRTFRKNGKIQTSLTWRRFLKSQIQSIYAMDFITVDTLLNKRLNVLVFISHRTREIVQFAITENPVKEFVRQQLIRFRESIEGKVYLIHDNASVSNLEFMAYGLCGVNTSVESPDMNSIMERFIRTAKREALDNFLIFNQAQVQGILSEFIEFYNLCRPHQGIGQQIPASPKPVQETGQIRNVAVLGGLHHHYYREAA
jgi:putative transposase